jgi:hypothetical protein
MPIPTDFDYEIAEIEGQLRGIVVLLGTIHRAKPADLPKMRETLKIRLQSAADRVMEMAANEEGSTEVRRMQRLGW